MIALQSSTIGQRLWNYRNVLRRLSVVREVESAVEVGLVRAARLRQGENLYVR